MTATVTPEHRAFEPDHYLDRRQPGWEIYEDRGLVRVERPPGLRNALVFVDADCAEVLQALGVPVTRSTIARR